MTRKPLFLFVSIFSLGLIFFSFLPVGVCEDSDSPLTQMDSRKRTGVRDPADSMKATSLNMEDMKETKTKQDKEDRKRQANVENEDHPLSAPEHS